MPTSDAIKISMIHPDYVNEALRFAEVEGIEAYSKDDGGLAIRQTDGGEVVCEEIVDKLVNGVLLAYTKALVARRGGDGG